MDKRIIYPSDEGGVIIVIPAPEAQFDGESQEDFLARIAAKDIPAGKPFKIIDAADVPTDRTFRDAWEYQE